MSERRRAAARGQTTPPAPSDQKVWGPDSGPYESGSARSRRRRAHGTETEYDPLGHGARTGTDRYGGQEYGDARTRGGYADVPAERAGRGRRARRDDSYGDDSFAAEDYQPPRGRRRAASAEPMPQARTAYADADFAEEDTPRRRGRRRADDGEEERRPRRRSGDDSGPPRGGPGRRTRGGGGGGKLGVWGWISVVMTSMMVIGTLTGYKLYRNYYDGLNRGENTDEYDTNRPKNQTGALNVLLVGSDSRAGANKRYGPHMNDGERTDTIMLLHVSPDRDAATLLSFPRDSMVMIPTCKNTRTGAVIPPHIGMINSAFSDGGMICTRRTIETLTQIRIDHYVKVDFTGFKNIVNALGGIEICLPRDVNDPKAKLVLSKGRHVVKGETALAYVRTRHGLGDGSDISRIKRQQVFIAQVVKKATSRSLLTDFGKLNAFISAVASSVTVDRDLNTKTIIEIAQSASKLTASGFKATTVPWEPYPQDPNRVQWKQPDAERLFNAIRNDTEVTATASPSASASAGAKTGPVVTKPSQVKVQVFNGTNIDGKAREVAEELAGQGFKVVGIGDARRPDGTDQPKTMIRYTGRGWDYAKVLAGKVQPQVSPETGKVAGGPVTPFTPSSPSPNMPKGKVPGPVIQLVIGADWKGVKLPLQLGDDAVTAKTDICAN